MTTVRPFGAPMIEAYLKSEGLRYLTDSDGDFQVQFSRGEHSGREITVWFCRQGENKEIYALMAFADRSFRNNELDKAIKLCNEWNADRRWPKAYVHMKGNDDNRVVLEMDYDFEDGMHQEYFDRVSSSFLGLASLFWTWMREEKGF